VISAATPPPWAIVLLVGLYMLKLPFDDLLGVASGATDNPAILVYAGRMAPTERRRRLHQSCPPGLPRCPVGGILPAAGLWWGDRC
jgi:hypothetical protein